MVTESTWSTTSTEKLEHPVREFLRECGVEVADFPRINFLIEINESIFKNTQVYIPLRIPGRPGVVFESYCRILRVSEIPSIPESSHRTFLELEWIIEETPLLEVEHHAVFSFLSGEVECLSCKHIFNPDPAILDDKSVKVSCPNCLHYWTIKVDSSALNSARLRLITDAFYKDPSKIQKSLADWDLSKDARQSDESYLQYFPIDFEGLQIEAPLDFIFGERLAFKIKSGRLNNDFEILSKSLINRLVFQYFRSPNDSKYSSQLEKTDICRKSDVQIKEEKRKRLHAEFFPAREFETIRSQPSESPFEQLHFGNTQVKEMKWTAPARPEPAREKNRMALFLSTAASLLLIGGIGFYFWSQRGGEFESEMALKEKLDSLQNNELLKPEPKETELANRDADLPSLKTEILETKPVVKKEKTAKSSEEETIKPVEESDTVKTLVMVEKEPEKEEAQAGTKQELVLSKSEGKSENRNLAKMALIDAGYRQGMLHLKLQQAKEAALEFEKVIQLDPGHTDSYRNLGLAYVYDRRFEDAITAFEKYLNLAGESEDRNSVEELLATLKDRVSLTEAKH